VNKTVHRISELAAPETPAPSAAGNGAAEPAAVRRIESASLFQRGREVIIVHHGQEYRLRITKSDKLILTK
jgi:hemin uptake protein HemP